MFDMPLEELKSYRGISPKPGDFDEYWDRALAEMKRVDPCVRMVRSDFQVSFADCYEMDFTGVRGARIHAKIVKPKNAKEKCPAVLWFHGYTCSSGDWYDKLAYAAAGFVVAAIDCRGQGGRSEDVGGVRGNTLYGHVIRGLDCEDPQDLLMRHVFLDCAELAGILAGMEEVDPERIGAFGGSQGGGLTIACAALADIRRLALYFPFFSDYKRAWMLEDGTSAYRELRDYFRLFDPLHEREEEVFYKLGYIDIHNLASRIRGSAVMGVTLQDTACPPSTQFAAYNSIPSPKKLYVYSDYGHENIPYFADITFAHLMGLRG